MVLFKPVQAVCDEEIANFIAAVVENKGAPIAMFSLPRIGMLIEMCAIK